MKLALPALVLLTVASGCSSRVARVQVVEPTVSTTKLTSGELGDAADAPRVGKPQHSTDAQQDESLDSDKDEVSRKSEHRRGGGFSGYK